MSLRRPTYPHIIRVRYFLGALLLECSSKKCMSNFRVIFLKNVSVHTHFILIKLKHHILFGDICWIKRFWDVKLVAIVLCYDWYCARNDLFTIEDPVLAPKDDKSRLIRCKLFMSISDFEHFIFVIVS